MTTEFDDFPLKNGDVPPQSGLGFLLRLRRGGSRNLREKHAEIEEIMGETQGLTRPGKHMDNLWWIYG